MPEDKDNKNINPDSGDEEMKWPPDFDSYSDEENLEEALSEKPEKSDEPSGDDKPSFFAAAAGFSDSSSEEEPKKEEADEIAETEEEFPWLEEESSANNQENEDEMSVLFPGTEAPSEISSEESIDEESIDEESSSASFLTSFLEDEQAAPSEESEIPVEENSTDKEFTPEDTGASILTGLGDPVEEASEETDFSALTGESEDIPDSETERVDDGNPYRAYASYDYVDTALLADEGEEAGKLKVSRPLLVFLIVLMLVGGYFGYQKITAGRYKFSKRERKRRVREPRKIIEVEEEKLPLWAVTQQKKKESGADNKVILAALENSGRDNPFAVPSKIIALLRQDLEAQLVKEKPPEQFQRNAYRAQLVGVVSSAKQVLALVNLRIADFVITEDMTKVKIIDTATKSMNRAKDEPLELLVGDSVGPWEITEIRDGRDGSEARVFIKRGEEEEELRIGVPVDLGIYDEEGALAVFKDVIQSE